MQSRSEDQRELLDAEAVAGHLLKPGSVFMSLAEHRRPGDHISEPILDVLLRPVVGRKLGQLGEGERPAQLPLRHRRSIGPCRMRLLLAVGLDWRTVH